MIANNNTVLFRIKNNGTFIAMVAFNFLFQGEIKSHITPDIVPNMEYKGNLPKAITNIHMIFHNKSAEGNPVFDEQFRQYAVPTCFLLTGDAYHPLCIPIPCSSLNCYNNYCKYCNFRYF